MDNYIKLIMPVYKNIYFKATYVRNQFYTLRSSLVTQTVKNPPAMQETGVQSPGQEDPLEVDMATHSSILAWRIPWTEEPGGLQSLGLERFGNDWETNGEGNGTPLQYSCLENPMDGGAGRLQSMGSLRVGHDWATLLLLFTFMHWGRKWQPTPIF